MCLKLKIVGNLSVLAGFIEERKRNYFDLFLMCVMGHHIVSDVRVCLCVRACVYFKILLSFKNQVQ